MPRGSLVVVGTGIRVAHLTPEALAEIRAADEVFYLAADPVSGAHIRTMRPRAQSLYGHYERGRPRAEAYERMVAAVLAPARAGLRVAAAFYGHPGVFVAPSHEAVRRARAEGIPARLLPGISAEDCLFADLGIDPALHGCASYAASQLIERRPPLDVRAYLVLWQVSVIGDGSATARPSRPGLALLTDALLAYYPPEHPVTSYEASPFPTSPHEEATFAVGELNEQPVTMMTTIVVPPLPDA